MYLRIKQNMEIMIIYSNHVIVLRFIDEKYFIIIC